MLKRVLVLLSIGILILPFSFVQPVQAAPRVGTENLQEVHASYSDYDASGCIRTYMSLDFIQHTVMHFGNVQDRFVETTYLYGQHNDCTGQQTLSGYILGISPIVQMTVDSPFGSARVVVDGLVNDFISSSMIPVYIDLTWTGTGPFTHDISHTNIRPYPGCRNIDVTRTGSRPASVTGTVNINGLQLSNLSSDPYFAGSSNFFWDISCP